MMIRFIRAISSNGEESIEITKIGICPLLFPITATSPITCPIMNSKSEVIFKRFSLPSGVIIYFPFLFSTLTGLENAISIAVLFDDWITFCPPYVNSVNAFASPIKTPSSVIQ